MFPRRAFALLLCILAGAAAALVLMPRIVRVSRDDTSRLCTIVDACRSKTAPPLVLFGNSAGMFGVDTGPLHGWNLCSPAQTLAEGFLLQQELPPNVNVIVQYVTQAQLASDYPIEPDHYNALLLCGYRPREATTATIASVFGFRLEVRPLADRLYARRHVRAGLEGAARDLLGGEGGGWLPERRFADLVDERYAVREPQLRILRESAASAARGGRRYLVVLAPIHPRLQTTPLACPAGLDCIDLTRLLRAGEFRDPTHPTAAGAATVTRALREAFTARRLLLDR